jgi:hypothetical protein
MRFKKLSDLKRSELREVVLATLPQDIKMAKFASEKAFKISELVSTVHKDSYEWYGYTIANKDNPELITDIGLPQNDQNLLDYTTIGPERIANFQETLPPDSIINGWIHSHGSLNYRQFSHTDDRNHLTVLDFVTASLRMPVGKREIPIRDLVFLVKDRFGEEDLERGSVSLITDVPVSEARIMETIYGGFCYSIVIGDEGWHQEAIHYKQRGILSGQSTVSSKEADILLVDTGRSLTQFDINTLRVEVEEKIRPTTDDPPEMIERM